MGNSGSHWEPPRLPWFWLCPLVVCDIPCCYCILCPGAPRSLNQFLGAPKYLLARCPTDVQILPHPPLFCAGLREPDLRPAGICGPSTILGTLKSGWKQQVFTKPARRSPERPGLPQNMERSFTLLRTKRNMPSSSSLALPQPFSEAAKCHASLVGQ